MDDIFKICMIRFPARQIAFAAAVLCAAIMVASCGNTGSGPAPPMAKNGSLDLSGWDFKSSGTVTLLGDWEFYWGKFLAPADFFSPRKPAMTGYFPVGQFWNDRRTGGIDLTGHGFATYRLMLSLPKYGDRYGIRIMEMNTSYRLWIDGNLVAEVGRPGVSKEETRPAYYTLERYFRGSDRPIEIIAQVANFHYRRGGIVDPIVVGTADQIKNLHDLGFGVDMFLLGSLLIMALYHFALFLLRRKDPSTLLFGLFCLIIALRRFILGETVAFMLFPDFPWELAYTMRYLSYPALPVFLAFMYSLFREYMPRAVTVPFLAAGIAFGISPFILPLNIMAVMLYPFMAATMATALYLLIVLAAAAVRRSREALVVLGGFIIIIISFVNDFLFHLQAAYFAVDLLSLGVFLFIFSQSLVLSLRFARAFSEVEAMSSELTVKNEALVNLDRIKDEFLANTSHELKTPVGGIIGIAESLRSRIGGLGGAADTDLSMIIASGRRLVTLVNDILDFSKLRHGDLRIHRRAMGLEECVDHVLYLVRPLVGGKKLELKTEIPPDLPALWADPDRVVQIMHNLVGNAVKFTDEGSVTVGARSFGGTVEVTVRDTGIGVPRDRMDRIFEPFEQADGSISRQFGGFGLGLSITRKLVELHGGSIRVESEDGKGSAFIVSMPAASGKAEHAIKDGLMAGAGQPYTVPLNETKRTPAGSPYAGERILVVDDEAVNLYILERHLAEAGYCVVTAKNGRECLGEVEKMKPDLIVLDVMMPGMSGYEVAEKLRKKYRHHELPVLMLTVRNRPEDLVTGFEAGANDYLVKPFYREELMARVENLLAFSRSASMGAKLDMMNYELDLAMTVQQSFMTGKERLGAIDWLDIAVRFIPLNGKVSGDYYHVRERADGTVFVFLADVTGHGVQAALYTAQIDLLVKEDPDDSPVDSLLENFNRKVMDNSYSRFFAAFAASIGETVRYSSAGFHDQLLIRTGTGEIVPVGTRGKIIGLSGISKYKSGEVKAAPGDILLFFTDGIFDVVNEENVLLDYGDFVDLARESAKGDLRALSMETLADDIIKRIDTYRGSADLNDDITLMAVRIGDRKGDKKIT